MDGPKSLIEHFSGIVDPRVERRKLHDLTEMIVVAIVAVVGGSDSFDDIEVFADVNSRLKPTVIALQLANPWIMPLQGHG